MEGELHARLATLERAHAKLPRPAEAGRPVGQRAASQKGG
jgi:hypothetical protein